MEDSTPPTPRNKRRKTKQKTAKNVVRLAHERTKRQPQPVTARPDTPAEVVSFRKAVKRLRKARLRGKSSTGVIGRPSSTESDATDVVMELVKHMQVLSDNQHAMHRKTKEAYGEFTEFAEMLGEAVRAMADMRQHINDLDAEVTSLAQGLTTVLRDNRRLQAIIRRTRTRPP